MDLQVSDFLCTCAPFKTLSEESIMDYSKQVFARLSETGMIVLPSDLSAEESNDCYRRLLEFADRANTDAELLRVDLHSGDAERIEKRVSSLQTKLHSIHALKLENECDYFLQHLRVRGAENSLIHAEKLLSHLLELSIGIQVAKHQAFKEMPAQESSPNKQQLPILLGQLHQSLEEFNDEKSLQIIEKLQPFGLGEQLTKIREFASSFEFDKAVRVLAELRSDSLQEKAVRKKTVLAVDDMPQLLTPLKAILGDKYKFVGTTSGEAALKYLENHLPDVYILDIDMPGMDGFQLVEAIRARRKIAPIIFLTANATVEYVTKAFDLGITDFLVKPCSEEAVLAKLEAVFSP